jgi:tetratricopeptide (TPR) repeat protein
MGLHPAHSSTFVCHHFDFYMGRRGQIKAMLILGFLFFSCGIKKQTPQSYFELGKHCEASGDYVKAAELLSKAIERDPAYIQAYTERAVVWFFQDSFRLAIADYTRAIDAADAK